MPNTPTLRDEVYAALNESLGDDVRITDDADLEDALGAESLDYLDMPWRVVRRVGVTIADFRSRVFAPLDGPEGYRSAPNTPARVLELAERELADAKEGKPA